MQGEFVPAASTWAIMSCFRPDSDVIHHAKAALAQTAGLIVVDDGSGREYRQVFSELEEIGATVHHSPTNLGIAAALNTGYRAAIAAGATHVVSLDQDSALPAHAVERLELAWRTGSETNRVGAVVPEYFADVRQATSEISEGVWNARNVIQSGMLVPSAVLESVGMMREDFFIDLVDTEFELRLRSAGFAILAASGVRIDHRLGRQLERRIFGRRVRLPGVPSVVTVSTPFRYYYRVRNRIVLNREYRGSHRSQILKDTILDILHFANVAMLARPRRRFWRIIRAGAADGRRGRMGAIPEHLMADARRISWAAPTASTSDALR
jgi:rhamnosyltransferase